jgi:hypothetical protein
MRQDIAHTAKAKARAGQSGGANMKSVSFCRLATVLRGMSRPCRVIGSEESV